MSSLSQLAAARLVRHGPHPMSSLKPFRPRQSHRDRWRAWAADLTLRHAWFRVPLHLLGMARCPRNIPWHWQHIVHEFYDRTPRP